jgi:hypothetical protein
MIPRRPTNLYYNVSTPTQWTNEYNVIYHSYWGRDLTYDEILDKESEVLLQYLLRGEVDPWMFHQANMRAYDAVHTPLGDLLDRALAKYRRLFVLPIRSPSFIALGEWVDNRMRYSAAGVVRASFSPSQGTMTITASDAVVVPVTGVCSGSSETYGGQCISHVPVGPGQTAVLHFEPTPGTSSIPGVDLSGPGGRVAIRAVGPNPFTRSTTITLVLPERAPARLVVYDVAGRIVRTLANDDLEAGVHPIAWDGRNDAGALVGDGVYFARAESGGQTSVRLIARIR